MIRAMLKDAERYYPLGEGVKLAIEYIRNNDLLALPAGKYPILGEKVFALIQEPTTQPPDVAPYENHKNHGDLQMTLRGTEHVGYCPTDRLTPKGDYNAETDVQLYESTGGEGKLLLKNVTGESFALFFPEDGHQPYVTVGKPEQIKKVVIRIRLDMLNG